MFKAKSLLNALNLCCIIGFETSFLEEMFDKSRFDELHSFKNHKSKKMLFYHKNDFSTSNGLLGHPPWIEGMNARTE